MLSKPASWTRIPDGSHPETQTCYQENSVLEHAPLENPDLVVRCAPRLSMSQSLSVPWRVTAEPRKNTHTRGEHPALEWGSVHRTPPLLPSQNGFKRARFSLRPGRPPHLHLLLLQLLHLLTQRFGLKLPLQLPPLFLCFHPFHGFSAGCFILIFKPLDLLLLGGFLLQEDNTINMQPGETQLPAAIQLL